MKLTHRLLYPPAWSIAAKLSAALLSVAIIPMSFTAYYNLRQSLDSLEAGEYRKLELQATSTASRLDQLIIDIHRVLVQVSSDRNVVSFLTSNAPGKQKAFRLSMQQTLENISHSNPDFDAIFLMDTQGKCVASTEPKFVGNKYNYREYFQQAIQGKSYVSTILVGQTTGRPGLFLSHPVQSEKGKIVGVAVFKIKGEDIWEIVNELHGSQSYAFLVDQYGVIISHPDQSLLYHSLNPLPPETRKQVETDRRYGLKQIESLNIPELAVMVGANDPGHTSYRLRLAQMPQIVGFAPLKEQPWVLGVNQPKAQFTAPLNRLIWQHGSIVLVVGGMTAIIALFLARTISRPIRALTTAAQALEQGDFNPQELAVVSRTHDDMGQLVRIFLHMAREVKTREQNLKQQVTALRIEIDETKRVNQVAEITENEHFKQLQKKIQKLKQQTVSSGETETEYFQRLHSKVQSLKERTSY
ncbi:HAMP domain-containing protein [Scytonema hofmannii PCC 7110]|uniref:histidine kinase n=1 Tax=Scytonema hofmannii PCC 7110 TaxID=128403 RepID=A0A139X7L9_9CYAN|nr:cache domain-containing protein [Scytonema hofmannii]KYC40655.1 HAMP domain-containing protein [Scytonema hofmannii PCC 7110]